MSLLLRLVLYHRIWLCMITAPLFWYGSLYSPQRSESEPQPLQRNTPLLWSEVPALPLQHAHSILPLSPADSNDSTRIAVIGDTRAGAADLGPSARWPSLVNSLKKHQPMVLLHLGDWVKDGTSYKQWQQTLKSLNLLDSIPILTVKGNHDRGGYFETFNFTPKPHNALRLSRVGDILFYLMDSEIPSSSAQEVVSRFVSEIKANPELWSAHALKQQGIKAKIWVQHRPIWSSGNHGTDERQWRSWLVPALETLDIDLMLAGHDHQYERFCASTGIDDQRKCDRQGVTYVISGGGGSVTVPMPNLSWKDTAKNKKQNNLQRLFFSDKPHYLIITLQQQTLHIKAWSSPYWGLSHLIDEFTLTHQ